MPDLYEELRSVDHTGRSKCGTHLHPVMGVVLLNNRLVPTSFGIGFINPGNPESVTGLVLLITSANMLGTNDFTMRKIQLLDENSTSLFNRKTAN